jgi:hypothetical protein
MRTFSVEYFKKLADKVRKDFLFRNRLRNSSGLSGFNALVEPVYTE